ncbi:MAG: tRNA 2-thiocytidine(32) synthetase TtcA [Oligoflexia bacterium]|nr:tRNA 2-thiocytidine(32) synthetase TtcA [Oligoflexia bacterium]
MRDDLKLEKKLFRSVGQAISDFNMIEEGDKIMVAVSGGKDSWAMLHVLNELQKKAPIDFEIVAVNLDQGYQGYRTDIIEDYLIQNKIKYNMSFKDINNIVKEKNQGEATWCSLCSRLRRGTLYGAAKALGLNKIALGHHQDDMIETLLLNAFFIGRLGSMAPKLRAEDGENIVIRPLIYVQEADIRAYTKQMNFPIVCCQCPLMCGESTHGDFKRKRIKNLLTDLEKEIPDIKNSLLASLKNVKSSHLLDKNFWSFE